MLEDLLADERNPLVQGLTDDAYDAALRDARRLAGR